MAQYVISLSNLQERTESSSTRRNNQSDTGGRQKQLITCTRRKPISPVMSIEQRRGSVSSPSATGKMSKRSERRKSLRMSWLKQQSNSLDIFQLITQMSQATPWSSPAPTRSNTGCCFRFCFASSHMLGVCIIASQNLQLPLIQKRNEKKTRTIANKMYVFTNRGILQHQGLVWGEAYHVLELQPTTF